MELEKLSEEIAESVISDDLTLELLNDISDMTLKEFIEGPLGETPGLKPLTSLIKFTQSMRNYFLIKKILLFLNESQKIKSSNKESFIKKLTTDRKYYKRVGENLVIILDRFDHLNKAAILAKLFISFLIKEITEEEFFRLSSSVEKTYLNDLNNISIYYQNNLEEVSQTAMQNLYQSGLVSLHFNNIPQPTAKLVKKDENMSQIQSAIYVRNSLGLKYCQIIHNYNKATKIIVPALNDIGNKIFELICKQEDINKDYFKFVDFQEELKNKLNITTQLLNFIFSNFHKLYLVEKVSRNAIGDYFSLQTSFLGYNFYFKNLKDHNIFLRDVINCLLEEQLNESNSFSIEHNLSQRKIDHCLEILEHKGLLSLDKHVNGYLIRQVELDELKKYMEIL